VDLAKSKADKSCRIPPISAAGSRSPGPRFDRKSHARARISLDSLETSESWTDWMVERCEFELPVPICVQSDDSIRLRFAKTTRTAKRHRPAARFLCALGSLGATGESPVGGEISGNNRARPGRARARFRMSVEMLCNNSQNGSPSARRFAMCLDKKVLRDL